MLTRMTWLFRRMSRMYWQEVPFRVASVLRANLRRHGIGSAQRPPPMSGDSRFGNAWVDVLALKTQRADAKSSGLANAQELLIYGHPVRLNDGLPDWTADPVSGLQVPAKFGLDIDFRHLPGLDIKFLWEINRHAWWVELAMDWAMAQDEAALDRLAANIDSWIIANPYPVGPNWASPVEHGIRLINWSIVWHVIGGDTSRIFQRETGRVRLQTWLKCIYQHVHFAADNYSFYSSADNHLIGEAAGVFVASHTWDCWQDVRDKRKAAKRILETEALKQFAADGVNREQALSYHKFSLQFLIAAGLVGLVNGDDFSGAFWERLQAALVYLAAQTDCVGNVPTYGDSDDGDVWSLRPTSASSWLEMLALASRLTSDPIIESKCASLGVSPEDVAAWLPPGACGRASGGGTPSRTELPRHFLEGGYVILGAQLHERGEARAVFDCGPLGYNKVGGHAHADALSLILSVGGTPVLRDSGTYCYNASPEWRRFFRSTAAHNTLTIDGEDQSVYGSSFLWLRDVHCTVVSTGQGEVQEVHACHDGFRRLRDPVMHHRRVRMDAAGSLEVQDWLECRESHHVKLHWHVGTQCTVTDGNRSMSWQLRFEGHTLELSIDGPVECSSVIVGQEDPPQGWASERFYSKRPAEVIVIAATLAPGTVLTTRVVPLDIHGNAK
ncbi:alginate lyase family protein [Ideonella sp. DXS22W]|uniref:Alginate lyase family protein n=1 Tax=Pseudaquabacterium inlustre TaxID=2984192 RepID=A0ABU9CE22_9BURK